MKEKYDNVFVGISLCNKILNNETVEKINQVATEEFRALRIAYLIADDIDIINRRVFDHGQEACNLRKVEAKASALEMIISQNARGSLKSIVKSVRWVEILNATYWNTYFAIFSLFIENKTFRNDVKHIANLYAERRAKTISDEELTFLSQYLLQEIPTLLQGVEIEGRLYSGMIYPSYAHESMEFIIQALRDGQYGFTKAVPQTKIKQLEL